MPQMVGAVHPEPKAPLNGHWKYLRKALYSMSQERAEKACMELGLFIRMLDDREDVSGWLKQLTPPWDFGRLVTKAGPEKRLMMHDVANKIIHASALDWDLSDTMRPLLICESKETERWVRAEIDIVTLAAFCGTLMS